MMLESPLVMSLPALPNAVLFREVIIQECGRENVGVLTYLKVVEGIADIDVHTEPRPTGGILMYCKAFQQRNLLILETSSNTRLK